MSVRFVNGDCRNMFTTLPAHSFDCVIADPPYGETSLAWDHWPDGWPALVLPILKASGSMWVFGSLRMFMDRREEFSGWKLSHEIVWEKHNGTGLFNDRFRRVHELVVHFYPATSKWADVFKAPQFTNDATARMVRKKGQSKRWIGATGETTYKSEDGGPRLMRSVLSIRSEHGRAEHPTQKPLGLVESLLRYACPPGGQVLDPFGGSGTTAIAAKLCGMDATLIELNVDYHDIAVRRVGNDAPLFAMGLV
jgi:site-specific DNA-methyltransferase (adenine-specific)